MINRVNYCSTFPTIIFIKNYLTFVARSFGFEYFEGFCKNFVSSHSEVSKEDMIPNLILVHRTMLLGLVF